MEAHAADSANTVRELSLPVYQSKGWLRLLGVLAIIYGVITAMTLVGIVIAWLPIWMGILLLQAASSIERAHVSGNTEPLYQSLGKLRTYFTIQGVLALIGLLVTALAFALGLFGAVLEAVRSG